MSGRIDAVTAEPAPPTAVLTLPGGEVKLIGKRLPNGVGQFLGVPYAEPLTPGCGERVFESPQPLRPETMNREGASGERPTMPATKMHGSAYAACVADRQADLPLGNRPFLWGLLGCAGGCQCCIRCQHACRPRSEQSDASIEPCVYGCGCCGPKYAGRGLDVLRMNIWSPPSASDDGDGSSSGGGSARSPAAAPVLCWLHGGGPGASGRLADPRSGGGGGQLAARGLVVEPSRSRDGHGSST